MSPSPPSPLRRMALLALALLTCVLLTPLLSNCDGEHSAEGISWKMPPEETMPPGFCEEDGLPFFTRYWRMPKGFKGFVKRWNDQAAQYVREQIRQESSQMASILVKLRFRWMEKADRERLNVQLQESYVKLKSMQQRETLGDYLVFRTEDDLPADLQWQDGMDQPELGSPKAIKGGVLRMALPRSFPSTLLHFGPGSYTSSRRYLYDDIEIPLVRFHPGTQQLIPGTADRWAVSPDGCTVYFHLDERARFSNGAALTTRDFVTSLFVRTSEYSMEPFFRDYYLSNFSRITVYGNHVLAVTLPYPRPYAPYFASIPACCTGFYAEFGPDYPTRYQWRAAPTTGGYRVAEDQGVTMGRRIVLERVPDWWAADRRYTRYSCNVDHIVYSYVSDAMKARELFRIGELDVYSSSEPDFWYEGLEIAPVYQGLIQRVQFSNLWPRNSLGIYLNCTDPVLRNRYLRAGLHYAFNMQEVIAIVFRGDATRAGSFFEGFGLYTDETITAAPYSPEKARELFAKAGYIHEGSDGILRNRDGQRLQITVSSRVDPLFANCMSVLREYAQRCGLDLRYDPMDDTVFYRKVMDKQVQASLFAWGMSPPMPNPAPMFHSQSAYQADGTIARGTSNITATSYPSMDSAILSTRYAATEEEAIRAHHRVQQLIHRTYAWIPGWYSGFVRFAQWRWVRWPDEKDCRFCPPRYYDPLDSHLYWIDETIKRETLDARSHGETFPEQVIDIPLPATTHPANSNVQ